MINCHFTITLTIKYVRNILNRKFIKNPTNLLRALLSQLYPKPIDFLKQITVSPEFLFSNRQFEKDFTRNGKFPFHLLIVFLINFVHSSYQDNSDHFFKTLFCLHDAQKEKLKAAFSIAKIKLKFQAMVELNHHLSTYFEKHVKPLTWNDFRLLSIVGPGNIRSSDQFYPGLFKRQRVDSLVVLQLRKKVMKPGCSNSRNFSKNCKTDQTYKKKSEEARG